MIRRFELPANMREIPVSTTPIIVKPPFTAKPPIVTKRNSDSASHELEAGLRDIFENHGLSIPTPTGNLSGRSGSIEFNSTCSRVGAAYIPPLSKYIQTLRNVLESEATARAKA